MKIVEAIKCYFSLFMSTFNLTFLYYILFQAKFKQKRIFFIHALYSFTQYIHKISVLVWICKERCDISRLAVSTVIPLVAHSYLLTDS